MNLMTLLIAFGLATTTPSIAPKMPLEQTEAIKQEIVTVFGKDSEIMLKVAECESGVKHFNKEGDVILSNYNDVGALQINAPIWALTSEKLGYDIQTIEGNIKMAKYIHDKQGKTAWTCYRKLFGKG